MKKFEPCPFKLGGKKNMKELAIERLRKEEKTTKADKFGTVIRKPLLDVLCDFCAQDQKFPRRSIRAAALKTA